MSNSLKIEFLKEVSREAGHSEVREHIDTRFEDAKVAGRDEIKDLFDPLFVEYNAKVLIHRNLSFLGEGCLDHSLRPGNTLLK